MHARTSHRHHKLIGLVVGQIILLTPIMGPSGSGEGMRIQESKAIKRFTREPKRSSPAGTNTQCVYDDQSWHEGEGPGPWGERRERDRVQEEQRQMPVILSLCRAAH